MELSKVTSKGQVTIPKKVRNALDIRQGDVLRLVVEGDRAILTKVAGNDEMAELKALQTTLAEWSSPADEDAYRDL